MKVPGVGAAQCFSNAVAAVALLLLFVLDTGNGDAFHTWMRGEVTVETEYGEVVGRVVVSQSGKTGNSFLGIRYAKPPVGRLRFEPPVPPEPWAPDYEEAFEFAPSCVQAAKTSSGEEMDMSEDCLFLNVWSPKGAKAGEKLPVMVWVYGGGFQQGTSAHPEYHGLQLAATRGVVVVTFNYRVGAFGFMVSIDEKLWGNYGLQDQRLAIEWVKRNIEAFGGDPDNVTLFGESAGAMSIGLHMQMDGAGQLFHKVIMQSNPYGYRYRSISVANFLGQAMKRALDCGDLRCLQEESMEDIMRIQNSLMGVPRSVGDFFTWGPVITESRSSRTRLSDRDPRKLAQHRGFEEEGGAYVVPMMNVSQPMDLMEGGDWVPPVPVLLGSNAHEGEMFVYAAFPVSMPQYVYWAFVTALFRGSAKRILKQYGPMARKYRESKDYRPVMSAIMHDYLFHCPTARVAHLIQERASALDASNVPVYLYEFRHPTVTPGFSMCNGKSCHTAELPYVFDNMGVITKNYSYSKFLERKEQEEGLHWAEGSEAGAEAGSGTRSGKHKKVVKEEKTVAFPGLNPAGVNGSSLLPDAATDLTRIQEDGDGEGVCPVEGGRHRGGGWRPWKRRRREGGGEEEGGKDRVVAAGGGEGGGEREGSIEGSEEDEEEGGSPNSSSSSSSSSGGGWREAWEWVKGLVTSKGGEDAKVASFMADYWTTFARTGDPNFAKRPTDWKKWKGRRRWGAENQAELDKERLQNERKQLQELEQQHFLRQQERYQERLMDKRRGRRGGGFGGAVGHSEGEEGELPTHEGHRQGRLHHGKDGWMEIEVAVGGRGGDDERLLATGEVETEVPYFLEISATPKAKTAHRECVCQFWDALRYRY